ncbi:MAG: hypothetical protein KF799_07095 [Bdellovibrionales bacterium]|nr:hypothetical protein [Bdellovibrionales bacterium]
MKVTIAAFVLTILAVVGCAKPYAPMSLQHTTKGVEFLSGDVAPAYCSQAAYEKEPACFASAPEKVCEQPYYSNSPACLLSAPAFCSEPSYGDTPACYASAPQYCEDDFYANKLACLGTMPNYCDQPEHSTKPSCLRLRESKLTYYCRRLDTLGICPEAYRY